ncbi:MAG TPA: NAD(P)-dependent oxidoreductase [Anaerolineales bacterium]|nr:NAD(P)-dependent oxidoreductase [Anaerolineales bacterium]
MLIALTGVTGFLGRYTAAALRQKGHRVRALVRSAAQRSQDERTADEWQVGDQYDPLAQSELVAGADAVIQAAIDWTALNQGPNTNFERNVLGSLRLLEAAKQAGVRQFLFVSSLDVYHEILSDRSLDETHPTWPASIYGAYKAAVELHLKAYHATHAMNTSAWRPATMYGLNPKLQKSLWFDLVKTIREGGEISTDADIQLVHVEDVAEAMALGVGDESVAGQFYNLVDYGIKWQEAAEIARALIGSAVVNQESPSRGAQQHFNPAKAIAFFDQHGDQKALRRDEKGVTEYLAALLTELSNRK